MPKDAQKCIASWKKYLPDYEIKEWNESNFDVNCCQRERNYEIIPPVQAKMPAVLDAKKPQGALASLGKPKRSRFHLEGRPVRAVERHADKAAVLERF